MSKVSPEFCILNPAQVKKLLSLCSIIFVGKGEFVYEQGQQTKQAFLMLHGGVKMEIDEPQPLQVKRKSSIKRISGVEKPKPVFGRGTIIGHERFQSPAVPYQQSAIASEDSILIQLNEEAYIILVKEFQQKQNEEVNSFILNVIPSLSKTYSANQIQQLQKLFQIVEFNKG
jgi:CRP-like cAMP-binding protein